MTNFYNKAKDLRLILDSEMLGVIETFWVLEALTPTFFGDKWKRVCKIDRADLDKCKRKHKLKPLWQVI